MSKLSKQTGLEVITPQKKKSKFYQDQLRLIEVNPSHYQHTPTTRSS
jgi:hypothetical protein